MMLKKANYELELNTSDAALARFMRGLLLNQGALTDHFFTGPRRCDRYTHVVLLVKLPPQYAELFCKDVRPDSFRYRSPTRLKQGSLVALYQNPMQEIDANVPPKAPVHRPLGPIPPLTPRLQLRESLAKNAQVVKKWPPEVRSAISTARVLPKPGELTRKTRA